MTRDELNEKLSLIGWSIENSHDGYNDWIYNHKNENTGMRCDSSGVVFCINGEFSSQATFYFLWKGSAVKRISKTCVCIYTEDEDCKTQSFINLYNHTLRKNK